MFDYIYLSMQTHPWVTVNGTNPLLSEEENTAQLIEPPTEEEMNMAITGNFGRLMTVVSVDYLVDQVCYKEHR